MESALKTILIVVIFGTLGFFIWRGFSADETDTLGVVTTGTLDENNQPIGADIEALLAQLNEVKIDATLFESPAYKSLNDYTNTIPPLPQGKVNPFAPFPGTPAKAVPKTR